MSKLELTYFTELILTGKSLSATLWFCFLSFNPFYEAMSTESTKKAKDSLFQRGEVFRGWMTTVFSLWTSKGEVVIGGSCIFLKHILIYIYMDIYIFS